MCVGSKAKGQARGSWFAGGHDVLQIAGVGIVVAAGCGGFGGGHVADERLVVAGV